MSTALNRINVFALNLFETPGILRATEAWSVGTSGSGQVVAIVDSGVERAHPFLSGKVVAEACFSNAPQAYDAPATQSALEVLSALDVFAGGR